MVESLDQDPKGRVGPLDMLVVRTDYCNSDRSLGHNGFQQSALGLDLFFQLLSFLLWQGLALGAFGARIQIELLVAFDLVEQFRIVHGRYSPQGWSASTTGLLGAETVCKQPELR